MRIQFFFALFTALLAAGMYWYSTTAAICPAPISYRLGELDSEFGLSQEEALMHMAAAERIWEEASERELFVYDENAPFPVNFIFDERQEFADTEISETVALDTQRKQYEDLFAVIDELQSEYESLRSEYEVKANSYEERLRRYNQTVAQYNDRGGAPQDEYDELQAEQAALDEEASELNTLAEQLNQLTSRLNELGERANGLVAAYNRAVSRYNDKYGYVREFTQGDYQGESINIYKFSSDTELEMVLAHEFGHALGIGHVEGESSVMYYLLADASGDIMLSPEDREALFDTCGDGNDFGSVIRRHIRGIITKF